LVLAERGTVILRAGNHIQKPGLKQKSQGTSARYEQPQPPKGVSGYDPEDKDMRGVFMARGPGKAAFNNVLFGQCLDCIILFNVLIMSNFLCSLLEH
jgi:hypothetical protein